MTCHCEKARKHLIILNDCVVRKYAVGNGGLTMAEYKCGDCFYADLCEESEILDGFNRDNPAYCSMFLNSDDVAPVRHGRWISLTDCSNAGVYCSVCHKKVYKEDYAICNRKNKLRSDYCPNCGAKMDGGAD